MVVLGLLLIAAGLSGGPAFARDAGGELTVHLAQANNDSPYAFVRAKFEPGELRDPWGVRFLDQRGTEVPYFVWDAITWTVARAGRPDWGNRYAILNHHPGDAPEALRMRPRRLEAAKQQLPDVGAALAAQDESGGREGDSVCAALYLVRYRVPPLGKEKLKLQIVSGSRSGPVRRTLQPGRLEAVEQPAAGAGELELYGLPAGPAIRWKGKELFRYAGFRIGDKAAGPAGLDAVRSHADPTQPFAVDVVEGIVTRVIVRGTTAGRAGSGADWQCTYWLFPEGGYVALKGFSLGNTDGYLGGDLSMAVWETPEAPRAVHEPMWARPWWLYQVGDAAFAAVHQFADTPLAVGYANNPFNASTPGSFHVRPIENPGADAGRRGGGALELNWRYELADPRICRLFHPRLDSDGSYNLAEITDLRETLSGGGKLTKVPRDATSKDGTPVWPADRVRNLEEALKFVKWRPKTDWLYRQYAVGLGGDRSAAEAAARQIVGAACGWLDRPFEKGDIADLIVAASIRNASQLTPSSHQQAWRVLPAALHAGERPRVQDVLRLSADPAATAAGAMETIRKQRDAGGSPIQGATKDGGEGWHNNPAYAAVDVPVALRFMDHFHLYGFAGRPTDEYRAALLRWADFSLETLGGDPLNWDRLRTSLRALWPNRVVMLVPLMLRAFRETGDEKYARAARLVFDDLIMPQVEAGPQGYFWAWGPSPEKAELFDPNYNMAAYDRGLIDFWSEDQLPLLGRDRASRFVGAQARYLVFSGQFLDTLETDSMTAVQSPFPGGIPSGLGQVAVLLSDDFDFYRGLVGDMIRWGAVDDGGTVARRDGRRNFYTLKIGSRGAIFWAYGISRDAPAPSPTARDVLARWKGQ